jgi:hypothetical protein
MRRLPERNVRRGFFERTEFESVVVELPEHLTDAARFAYLTGWRKGEVAGLRWEWVDTDAGTITLPDSKNGKGRVLALSGDLAVIFDRREEARLYKDAEGEPRVADLVFHRQGRPLGDFRKAWHAALTAAGFSHRVKTPSGKLRTVYTRTFHDFRRTAARNLVRAGVREGVAMTVTGHKTRSVFDRYNITSTADVAQAIEAVSKRSRLAEEKPAMSDTELLNDLLQQLKSMSKSSHTLADRSGDFYNIFHRLEMRLGEIPEISMAVYGLGRATTDLTNEVTSLRKEIRGAARAAGWSAWSLVGATAALVLATAVMAWPLWFPRQAAAPPPSVSAPAKTP